MTRQHTKAPRAAARACLFGGAIFAAGVAASDADAQTFAFQYHYHRVLATGPNYVFQNPFSDGPFGIGNTVRIQGDFSGYVFNDNTEVSFSHDRSGNGTFNYSTVEFVGYFLAVEPMTVRAQWDAGGWATQLTYLLDVTAGSALIDSTGAPVGDETATLEAEHQFLLVMYTRGNAPGGPSWGSLTVVEPCLADLDGNGVLNVDDIEAFVAAFLGGCPG